MAGKLAATGWRSSIGTEATGLVVGAAVVVAVGAVAVAAGWAVTLLATGVGAGAFTSSAGLAVA